MFCSKYGEKLSDSDQQYCQNCGIEITTEKPQSKTSKKGHTGREDKAHNDAGL